MIPQYILLSLNSPILSGEVKLLLLIVKLPLCKQLKLISIPTLTFLTKDILFLFR